jgi:tRNA nucleotidyltransferase/poly(A) polymerase
VRFSTTLNFKLDKKSEAAIKKYAYLVKKLPAERVKSELDKIICSNNFYEGIELMEGLGLLAVIFPELERLKSVKQSDNFHAEGNAFIHSMRAFKSLWSKNKDLDISLDDPQKVFRYAVLFHDLGKFGSAKSTIRDGRKHMSFPEHGPKGADIFLGIAKRLKFPTAEKQQIVLLIQHHMDMRRPAEINDQTIAKWIVSNPNLESMIALRYIDDLGSIRTNVDGKIIAQDFSALDIFAKKVKLFKKRSAKNLLTGDDIMNILDLKESEEVGRYMSKIKEMQILGMVKNKEDAIMELKNLWKNQKIY